MDEHMNGYEAMTSAFDAIKKSGSLGWECVLNGSCRRSYPDGEAVVSLDTVFIALGFGVVVRLSFRGKVQVVVHDLTPLHEEQGSVLVQNLLLLQVASDLVGDFTGLHREGREVRLEESMP